MFRPKGNAGQAGPPGASAAEDTHQPKFNPVKKEEQLDIPTASTYRVTQQTMFRPVKKEEHSNTSAASTFRATHQPQFHPVKDEEQLIALTASTSRATQQTTFCAVRNAAPATTAPPAPAPWPAGHDMTQFISQLRNHVGPNHTHSTQTFHRPPRFLSSARRDPEPTNASSTMLTSRSMRPTSRFVDSIESDGALLPENASALSSSRVARRAPRFGDSTESDGTLPLPASRKIQQPILQPTRKVVQAHAPTAAPSRAALQSTIPPTRTFPAYNSSASSARTPQQPIFRPVRATAAPANAPAPPASASMLEFNCLYTHDLRRKKKRWQDGKLKFHTFNKKYMVYDEGGSFVGDGHWQGGESAFAEGLELNLDRGMAIVQVLECTGSKEQDLGEVLGKRAREVEERRAAASSKNLSKRTRGAAVVVQASPSITTAAAAAAAIPPPKNEGVWSKHAVDLLGMTRPIK